MASDNVIGDLISKYQVQDPNKATAKTDTLGKNDFLNLLVTQLKNQDPLDPVKNEAFVAQLAQFNSLEQMLNLNTSMSNLLLVQQMGQATQLIGQPVAYQNAAGETLQGIAQSVTVVEGVPQIQVNSDMVPFESIIALGQATTSDILASSSYLIGKQVSWLDADGTRKSGIVASVELNGGAPLLTLTGNSGKTLGLSDIIAVASPT